MLRVLAMLFLVAGTALAEPVTVSQLKVIDGDTVDVGADRFRMVGYDTPEIKTSRRKVGEKERALAAKATARFVELLNSGPLDLTEVRCSCSERTIGTKKCNGGRKCGILTVSGVNVGKTLIAENLAAEFVCRRNSCPRMPDWPGIAGDRH